MTVWPTILEALERHGVCALVTVIAVDGSAPRETGARMVVLPDGSFSGTIGGGRLEYDAIQLATELIEEKEAVFVVRNFSLGPDLGQCCGGRVRLAVEVIDGTRSREAAQLAAAEKQGKVATYTRIAAGGAVGAREIINVSAPASVSLEGTDLYEAFGESRSELWLFGAGHVGKALVLALAPLPFNVTWIDSRRELFPSRVPVNCKCVFSQAPSEELKWAPDGTSVIIMTHSHALDGQIADTALRMQRIASVGMIGSKTKRARMLSRFCAGGISEDALSRFECPIGLPAIRSKLPAAIAVSIAAELLASREAAHEAKPDGSSMLRV